jgi:hypothetical protein
MKTGADERRRRKGLGRAPWRLELDHLKLLRVLRPIRVAAANLCSWSEQPFAWNMINL